VPNIRVLPDGIQLWAEPGENLLDAVLRAGIAQAHACGGHARCSTCRVEVQQGVEHCTPRSPAEQLLADRLGFHSELRLACQTVPSEDLIVRRLVLDEDDIELVDQRRRSAAGIAIGQERELAILFADIRGFTAFSERLPPHDVVHVLNRFFHAMGRAIAAVGGRINNYMGDGMMALFGMDEGEQDHASRAVRAGIAMLEAMDALKPYLQMAYGRDFDIGVGVHFGEVVVGTIGAVDSERETAIGDAVNFASRIEAANKVTRTRLLVSDAVVAQVGTRLRVAQSVTLSIPGKNGDFQLHEIQATNSVADMLIASSLTS
jgi:adenylate cyclase